MKELAFRGIFTVLPVVGTREIPVIVVANV